MSKEEIKSNIVYPEELKEKIRKAINNREGINNLKDRIKETAEAITKIMNGRDPEFCLNQLEGNSNDLANFVTDLKSKMTFKESRSPSEFFADLNEAEKALNEFFAGKYLYERYDSFDDEDEHTGFYIHAHSASIDFNHGDPVFYLEGTLVFGCKTTAYMVEGKHLQYNFQVKHKDGAHGLSEEIDWPLKEITKEEYEKAVKDLAKKAAQSVLK